MASGALERLQRAFDESTRQRSGAYGMQDQAYRGIQDYFANNPGSSQQQKWGALAAGFLSPTRSGSFGEGMGKAAAGYTEALAGEDRDSLNRALKLFEIQKAHGNLLAGRASDPFSDATQRLKIPGMAIQGIEDEEELDDLLSGSGDSGIPPMPGAGGIPAMPGMAPRTQAPAAPPPAMAPTQNPGTRVSDVAGAAAMDMPLIGGAGDDMLGGQGAPDDLSEPAPAAPPAAAQQPDMNERLYQWALQVRAAAAANPKKWARRADYKAALQNANQIIDDYRAQKNSDALLAVRQDTAEARRMAAQARAAQTRDPVETERKKLELKRMQEIEADSAKSRQTLQSLDKTDAARERMWLGEDWGTGPLGKYLSKGLDMFGVDSGAGALAEASGALRSAVIDAQNSGAISNFEVQMFDAQVPGIGMGKESADWVMNVGRAIAKRQQEQAKFFRRYQSQFGTIEGAEEKWNEFVADNPILDRDKDGKPHLYGDRAGKWESYLRPPGYLVESGRVKNQGVDSVKRAPQTDPMVLQAIEELKRRGVLK